LAFPIHNANGQSGESKPDFKIGHFFRLTVEAPSKAKSPDRHIADRGFSGRTAAGRGFT
jgi:hypothetical protein